MSKRNGRNTEKPDYILYSVPVLFGFAILIYGISRYLAREPAFNKGIVVSPFAYVLVGVALLATPTAVHMIQKKKK